MADDEQAVVLACTSLVFCALSVHVNKTEKRRHAVWVKNYLEKERMRKTQGETLIELSTKVIQGYG